MFPVCTLGPEAGRKRWQEQDAGGTPALPGDANHSPIEGESPRRLMRWGADAGPPGCGARPVQPLQARNRSSPSEQRFIRLKASIILADEEWA